MVYTHIRFFLFTALLLVVSAQVSQAQRSFGVTWDKPDNSQEALEELRRFSEMGISAIELKNQPAPSVWKEIDDLQLEVYGHMGIRFPLLDTFAEPDSSLITSIENNASDYLAQPSLHAIGLFEYGPIHQPEFLKAISPYVQQIQSAGATLYIVSSRSIMENKIPADFIIYDIRLTSDRVADLNTPNHSLVGAYRFSPQGELTEYLSPLKIFLNATADSPEKPAFLHSDWLNEITEKYPGFKTTLQSLAGNNEAVFPVPNESLPEQNPSVIPILSLLLAWGIIALLYHSSPIYRKALFRYFLGHKFFIKDVFQRQMRSPIPALSIIILHSLLLAASVFATFSAAFTPLGQEGFYYYFPILIMGGSTSLSLFLSAFTFLILIALISVLWLFFSHKSLRSITQVMIIYAWPLQVSFLTSTVAITLFSAGSSAFWIMLFTLLSFFIHLLGFILASVDAAGFIKRKSSLFLVVTNGIYLLLIGAITIWMYAEEQWREIIDLLVSLK